MRIERVPISKLNPAPYNPRKDLQPGDEEYEKLARSIDRFDYIDPIIWNERTGNVVGGHQRLKVLIARGATELDVSVVDLSLDEEKALNVALNKISGEFDDKLLAQLLGELNASELIDATLTGFSAEEIDELIANANLPENIDAEGEGAYDDDFDVDDALSNPNTITVFDDMWELGSHRLICGDSTNAAMLDRLMMGERADLVVTDPPYNVDYEGVAGKIKNDNLSDERFYRFLRDSFGNIAKAMSDEASIYVFHSDTQGIIFRRAFADAGFYLSGTCIWAKQSMVLGRSPYQWQHEPILFGWKKSGKHLWYVGRSETTLWSFDRPTKSELHPTMKPIPLVAYPIKNSSKAGDLVLDPFGGSGSTLIACEQMRRCCRTVELDPKYCDVIVSRYIAAVGTSEAVTLVREGKRIRYDDISNQADND